VHRFSYAFISKKPRAGLKVLVFARIFFLSLPSVHYKIIFTHGLSKAHAMGHQCIFYKWI